VEKVEGLTIDRFVVVDGWGSAGGRPATGGLGARPRNVSVRLWSGLGGGAVGAGRLGRPYGTSMVHWTRPITLEEGCSGRTTVCSDVREPAVLRPLKAGAAGAAVWGPASSECARGLGRRAWQEERTTDRGVERDGGATWYDAVNAARVPRRSARRGAGCRCFGPATYYGKYPK
jgi:hypothetical protein